MCRGQWHFPVASRWHINKTVPLNPQLEDTGIELAFRIHLGRQCEEGSLASALGFPKVDVIFTTRDFNGTKIKQSGLLNCTLRWKKANPVKWVLVLASQHQRRPVGAKYYWLNWSLKEIVGWDLWSSKIANDSTQQLPFCTVFYCTQSIFIKTEFENPKRFNCTRRDGERT